MILNRCIYYRDCCRRHIILPVVVVLVELESPGVKPASCLIFLVVVNPAFKVQILLMEFSQLFMEFPEFCGICCYCCLHCIHFVFKGRLLLLQLCILFTEVMEITMKPHQVFMKMFHLKLGTVGW